MGKSEIVRHPEGFSGGGAELPVWDLNDLYAAPDDARIEVDLQAAQAQAAAFEAQYRGLLAGLSGAELAAAVQTYERVEESLGRVMSYAQLLFAEDSTDPAHGKFYQTMSERVTTISTHLLFFTLELNLFPEAALGKSSKTPRLPVMPRGSGICGCFYRISSEMSWKSCCTRRT